MSIETYSVIIPEPSEVVWPLLKNPENWLPLLPDYLAHQELDATHYQVKMHLTIGPFDRDVELSFDTTSEDINETLHFSFQSTTAKVTGYGKLTSQALTPTETRVQLSIEIKLNGKSNILFKPALTKLKTSWSQETLNKIATLF